MNIANALDTRQDAVWRQGRNLRIAQVSPLLESVPPKTYGGTERIVHYLTEALVQQGHRVTLFASGDSQTSAELCAIVPEALRHAEDRDPQVWQTLQLAAVARAAGAFDIVHFHTDFQHFPLWRQIGIPQVTTLHGRLDLADLPVIYSEFSDMALVSISDAQRAPLPMARWAGTVYNGIPTADYRFRATPGDYLAFLGRFSPEKGAETAIEIAVKSNLPLKLAAKVNPVDEDYFNDCVRPLLDHPLIDYIGEVDELGKNDLLGNARALVLPIVWPEPFGLVMIEAMACGTPVIAYRCGAVPEVVADGVTGFIVSELDEALNAVQRLDEIDRKQCRRHFEARFSAARMAQEYLRVYQSLLLPDQPMSLAAGSEHD